MKIENFVGVHFLLNKSRKKRLKFVSITTLLTISCLAVSLTAIIVTMAIVGGFHRDLTSRIFLLNEHIKIQHKNGFDENSMKIVKDKIRKINGIERFYISGKTEVIIKSENKSTGGFLLGLELDKSPISEYFINNTKKIKNNEIVLGDELKHFTNFSSSNEVNIISPIIKRYTHFGVVPKNKYFSIVDYFLTGINEYDNYFCITNLETFNKFTENKVENFLNVKLTNPLEVQKISKKLQENLGDDFQISNWSSLDKNLFIALKLEKTVMFVVISLMFIIASFNIFGILSKTISEKRKDIAILESMGLSRNIPKKWLFYRIIGNWCGFSFSFWFTFFANEISFFTVTSKRIAIYRCSNFNISFGNPTNCDVLFFCSFYFHYFTNSQNRQFVNFTNH